MKKRSAHGIELLAPVGNFEKLEIAIHYGADAVYLAGKDFSLRNFSGNFTEKELYHAVELAHKHHVKVFLALNIYSRNTEQNGIIEYLSKIKNIGPDAIIISDPGIFMLAKEIIPEIDIHISTQSNTTNYNTALFWQNAGAKRVNTARELTLPEIKLISEKTDLEIESFIHGAMCISQSGRCLLSNFLSGKDSNRGRCNHPCRWEYSVVEAKRPGEYHPIMEDERGTYIFNSKDLCMIDHIPELIRSGITSLKIEGRMKGINYLASVIRVYRDAIDSCMADPSAYYVKQEWMDELQSISHRQYCTGFYTDDPNQIIPNYLDKKPETVKLFVGKIVKHIKNSDYQVQIRNKIRKLDSLEILTRSGPVKTDNVIKIIDKNGTELPDANPNDMVILRLTQKEYSKNDLIRISTD